MRIEIHTQKLKTLVGLTAFLCRKFVYFLILSTSRWRKFWNLIYRVDYSSCFSMLFFFSVRLWNCWTGWNTGVNIGRWWMIMQQHNYQANLWEITGLKRDFVYCLILPIVGITDYSAGLCLVYCLCTWTCAMYSELFFVLWVTNHRILTKFCP